MCVPLIVKDKIIGVIYVGTLRPGTYNDDHVHMRIACAPEEAAAGCSGGGPRWQWLPPYTPARPLEAQDFLDIARQDPLDVAGADVASQGALSLPEAAHAP